jgi:CubicO group peptidase (beta-lactamase class C family)
MNTAGIDAAMTDAVASGALVGAAAAVWSRTGTYEGVSGEADVGRPVAQDTMFHLASMTKAVTAVALMQLVEQQVVALDDPAGEHVPYVRDVQVLTGFGDDGTALFRAPARPITIRHLLTHTAGFAYPWVDEMTAKYVGALPTPAPGSQARVEHPPVFDPGESWAYGTGTDWLGRVVEAVSGLRLDAYFDAHIFGPLGMEDTTFLPNPDQIARLAIPHTRTPDGLVASPVKLPAEDPEMLLGGSGLCGTVGDYLRFTRMLLDRGQFDGERVLAAETVDAMYADQLESTTVTGERRFSPDVAADLAAFVREDSGWGLSFQIHRQGRPGRRAPGSVSWMGGLNTFYWVDPATQLTGVFATQVAPLLDPDTGKAFARFERAVYEALG